jgi:pimeloyl-ACP methyl ester carboxylesterase
MAIDTEFVDLWTEVPMPSGGGSLRIHSLRSEPTDVGDVPVVCVPGLGASAETMLPTARLLTGREVHILDLPGDGRSESPPRDLDLADHAAVCSGWLEAITAPSAVWLGHSFGTQVLVQLATDDPELVDRLVLISPTVDPRARSLFNQFGKLLLDGLHEPPALLRILIRDYRRAGIHRLRAFGKAALADHVEAKLPRIDAPTLVIRGENDPLVPAGWADRIVSLLPHGRLVVIAGAPHAVQYTAAEQVAGEINEFLGQPSVAA